MLVAVPGYCRHESFKRPAFKPRPSRECRPPREAGSPAKPSAVTSLLFRFPLGLLLALFLASPAPGETPPASPETRVPAQSRQLTLEEVVRLGVEASPKLWAQRYIIDQAAADLSQARAGRLPRMEYLQIAGPCPEARGNSAFSPDERTDLLNHLGPFTRLELTVNQPLYTFGKLKAHITAAEKGLEAKEAGLRRFELELVKTIKELYFTILLNDELHRLVSDTEEQFGKAVEKGEEELAKDSGLLTQQDLLKLRYARARASGQLLEIDKGRHLTRAALRRLMVLPEGEDFSLVETDLKPVQLERKDLRDYQEQAQRNRPEWRELEAGIAAREAELEAEQRKYFPDLFVTGLLRYAVAPNRDQQENPFAGEDLNYFNGGLYLGMRLELDMGLPARISGKRAELCTLMQDRRDAVSGMLLEVEKAYQEVVEKEQGLAFAQQARKNGRALAAMSAASFHLGLGEAREIFEAFGIYTDGAARYYLAVKDYNVAVAELARATGATRLE